MLAESLKKKLFPEKPPLTTFNKRGSYILLFHNPIFFSVSIIIIIPQILLHHINSYKESQSISSNTTTIFCHSLISIV